MSTRSMIFITGKGKYNQGKATIAMYKNKPLFPEIFVGKLLGESTTQFGIGASMESTYTTEFKETMVDHGDLEWFYIVNLEKKTVECYKVIPFGDRVGELVSPFVYLKQLDDQAEDKKAITSAINRLKKQGYTVITNKA
jgi:hypothetical protein